MPPVSHGQRSEGMSSFFFNNNSSSGNGIYSLLSEYNHIKSGTYYKVVKAYYAKQTAAAKGTKDTDSSKKEIGRAHV